jgi:hypothetical protein
MGTLELSHAYPRLKREWAATGGWMVRLTNPQRKGVPDFLLAHPRGGRDRLSGASALVEVKCVDDPRDIIGLDANQAKMLDEAEVGGARGRVLCLCLKHDMWGLFYGGSLRDHWRSLRWQMAPKMQNRLEAPFVLD